MTTAVRCDDPKCKHVAESPCHEKGRLHAPFCKAGAHPFMEPGRTYVTAALSAGLSFPVYFDWVGTTPRVFSADGSSAIVVANRAVGELVVAALNAFESK